MNEIEIKRNNFVRAKNRLKELSEKKGEELEIEKVRTAGGLLGLFDHKVTGDELNKRLVTIQNYFCDINKTNITTIKEFKEVYNALDALDKDYIASIVANVKAIEKTSNDIRIQQGTLKQHNEKLVNQQNKLDFHQIEMEKHVANMKKNVTILKTFQEKLDSYKHLTYIDSMWEDLSDIKIVIEEIRKNTIDREEVIQKQQVDLKRLNFEINEHKRTIDMLSQNLIETKEYAKSYRKSITELDHFREKVDSIEHLDDVDAMWKQGNDLKSNLADTNNSFISLQQKAVEIDNEITNITETMQNSVASLERKLKYAYFVAAGALGFAVVELFLVLTGVV